MRATAAAAYLQRLLVEETIDTSMYICVHMRRYSRHVFRRLIRIIEGGREKYTANVRTRATRICVSA